METAKKRYIRRYHECGGVSTSDARKRFGNPQDYAAESVVPVTQSDLVPPAL